MGMHSTYTATHYKDLNIDWQARAVTRHGEDISLTPQEFALLQVLFDHRGQAVSRGDLLHTAWGYPSNGITRTVDVHIQHSGVSEKKSRLFCRRKPQNCTCEKPFIFAFSGTPKAKM